jgi:hypothetical protein
MQYRSLHIMYPDLATWTMTMDLFAWFTWVPINSHAEPLCPV